MKLTLLGTGTPNPSLVKQGACLLFEIGSDSILMDLGCGAFQRYLETGRDPRKISHLFLSHLHYDHCVDYPRMALQRWDMGAGKIPELKVYGPRPVKAMTESLFGEGKGAFWPDLEARTSHPASLNVFVDRGGRLPRLPLKPEVTEIHDGDVVRENGWRVSVGSALHFQPQLECHGFRLDCEAGSVCYSGDTGYCKSMVELARGCDVLIHTAMYRTGTEPSVEYRRSTAGHIDAAQTAREAGAGALVLVHQLAQVERPAIRERLIFEIQEIFKGRIIWGEDLMEVPLKSSADTSIG